MPSSLNPFLWTTSAAGNDAADPGINWAEGQAPGSVNGSARAVMASLARMIADLNGTKTTGGGPVNYTIASANLDHTVLSNGLMVGFRANVTNTGASSLNLNSLGGKIIKVWSSAGESHTTAGQIVAGGHYLLFYNSTADSGNGAWVLDNPAFDSAHPTGAVIAFAGTSAPIGWLLCDGSAVSRTTYAALFAVIGTTYNTGGEAGTDFRLPDIKGRAIFGKEASATRITVAGSGINGGTLGAVGGLETHTLTTAQLASHSHTVGTLSAALTGPGGSCTLSTAAGTINGNGANLSVAVVDTHTHNYLIAPNRAFTAGTGTSNNSEVWVGTATPAATTGTAAGSITAAINANTISASLSWAFVSGSGTITVDAHTHAISGSVASSGSGSAHNNMPPVMIMNYIIKI